MNKSKIELEIESLVGVSQSDVSFDTPIRDKISAREFIALIDRAGHARDSLASCQDGEVLRESESARRAAETLLSTRLKRQNADLERQRDNMLRTMLRTARFRLDNLATSTR